MWGLEINKKTIMKRLLFTLTFALIASIGWSQCSIGFNATVSGNTVTLIPYDSSSSISYNVWNAPGGTPSTQQLYVTDTATVVYNSAGVYTICVIMFDSGWSCTDSFCDSVLITSSSNLATSMSSTATSCGACNGTATVTASGGTTPYSYLWSNGATTQAISSLCSGSYTVTVTDNNSNTSTSTVLVSQSGGINASISTSNNTPCFGSTVTLTASSNALGVLTYLWNTGATTQTVTTTTSAYFEVTVTDSNGCMGYDSTYVAFSNGPSLSVAATNETCASCCNGTATATATGSGLSYSWSNSATTATITGLCPGYYAVTVEDTNAGCQSIDSVYVAAYVASCYTIQGEIAQGSPARVYLIEQNQGVLWAADSVDLDSNNMYTFNNVCNGTYYVKAALLPNHNFISFYIPTYYDSAALWSGATAVVVNNASLYSLDFSLLSGINLGGPGFVAGIISQGANRGEGDPIVGAFVVAYNADGTVAGFSKTDETGSYNIDNLALGSYKVYVDVLNKTSYPHEITLSTATPEAPERNFEVTGDIVRPIAPTGISDLTTNSFDVYPNPTEGLVSIQTGEFQLNSIQVINVLGERVRSFNNLNKGLIEVNLDGLAAGSYILELNGEGFTKHQSIIVR